MKCGLLKGAMYSDKLKGLLMYKGASTASARDRGINMSWKVVAKTQGRQQPTTSPHASHD